MICQITPGHSKKNEDISLPLPETEMEGLSLPQLERESSRLRAIQIDFFLMPYQGHKWEEPTEMSA